MRTIDDIQKDMKQQDQIIKWYTGDGRSDGYCNSDSMRLRDAYEAYEKYRREYVVALEQQKQQA